MVPFSENAGTASSVFGIFQYGGAAILGYLAGAFYDITPLIMVTTITVSACLTLFSYWFFDNSVREIQAT